MEEQLVNLISNLGFPVAITIYLLVRFDGLIKKVILTQEKMITGLEKLCIKIDQKS